MKKSLYMKLQLCQDSDMQDYVRVSLSSARLVIFDIKSVFFLQHCLKQLLLSLDKFKVNEPTVMEYRLLINVSSFGSVRINLTDSYGNVLFDMRLEDLVLSYIRMVNKSPFDKFDVPDVLVLLSYFLTEKQRKLAGL